MDEKSASERYAEMVQQPYDVDVIRQAPDLDPGDEHTSVVEVQNFLKRFGYLDAAYAEDRTPESGRLDEVTVRALVEYQHFSGAGSGYGNLDAPTRESMVASRCGVPDVEPGGMLPGLEARYWVPCHPATWQRRVFTYAFGNVTSDVPSVVAKALVARAFQVWQNARLADGRSFGLSFHLDEVEAIRPDFRVEWRPANDPDSSMVGNVLAHADFPSGCLSGELTGLSKPLHFDDSEHSWTGLARPDRFSIQTIAIHEIGHLLGLGHTGVSGSIMVDSFAPNFTQHTLSEDDLGGLSLLFPPLSQWSLINRIRPAHSPNKVLDVRAQSTANGAPIQLWDSLRLPNQSFRPEYVGGGAFRFVAEHSGKVLEVYEGSQANGAQITQWDWHGGDNQKFYLKNPEREGRQWIMAVHSGKVLDVAAFSTANGAKIQQWDLIRGGARNQLFSIL